MSWMRVRNTVCTRSAMAAKELRLQLRWQRIETRSPKAPGQGHQFDAGEATEHRRMQRPETPDPGKTHPQRGFGGARRSGHRGSGFKQG